MSLRKFEIITLLGEGGYGAVVLAKSKENHNDITKNQLVAIKSIHKRNAQSIIKEIEVLKIAKNQMFLSQMLTMFQDRTHVFIVLRFEENGSLFDYIKRVSKIPIDFAQKIIVQTVLGLKFLHEQNIVHGDLKPENILLDNNLCAHVGDFGLSVIVPTDKKLYGKWGSISYQTPEQLLGNVPWDHRVDYFVCGIIFLQMITGIHPFGQSENEINNNTVTLRFKMPDLHCDAARSFIHKTLCWQDFRFDHTTIVTHEFIQPLIKDVTQSYEWIYNALLDGQSQIPPYYDNKNFLPLIPNVPYDGTPWMVTTSKSVQSPKPLTQSTPPKEGTAKSQEGNSNSGSGKMDQAEDTCPSGNRVKDILIKQLAKYNETDHGPITKEGTDIYRIACELCPKVIKAAVQKRGKKNKKKNWSVQPYKRHMDGHRRKKG